MTFLSGVTRMTVDKGAATAAQPLLDSVAFVQ